MTISNMMAGAIIRIAMAAFSLCIRAAKVSAPNHSTADPAIPSTKKVVKATLRILREFSYRPTALLSDTMREMATGSPEVVRIYIQV
ncbi:hypothetical protein SDC9_135305 [bioreactor metagenome]|uniref:Uncharacterized protein n=1 Tax=bioreactor metagenome TaxID=1076179 RepID=A0A645DFG9_9ZZZZ